MSAPPAGSSPVTVNGAPGFAFVDADALHVVGAVDVVDVVDGRIHRVDLVVTPAKLPRGVIGQP